MTRQELAQKLFEDFNAAGSGERTKVIVLFGIRYAEKMQHVSATALVEASGIGKNYAPMANLGRSLARHVDLKD